MGCWQSWHYQKTKALSKWSNNNNNKNLNHIKYLCVGGREVCLNLAALCIWLYFVELYSFLYCTHRSAVMIHREITNYPSLRVIFSKGWDLSNRRKIQHVSLRRRPHSLWKNERCCDWITFIQVSCRTLKYHEVGIYQTLSGKHQNPHKDASEQSTAFQNFQSILSPFKITVNSPL